MSEGGHRPWRGIGRTLLEALSAVTSELLKEKGYICFVDVLMKLDYLSQSDYEHWRFQRVSP